jgi:hypothetical protein
MAKRQLEVALDRSNADLQAFRYSLRRLSFNRNAAKHLAGTLGQPGQRAFESLDFGARFYNSRRVGSIIAHIQKRIDLGCADAIVLGLLPVLCNVDGSAKDSVGGAADRYGIGHPVQAQKCLVQSLICEFGRPQTAGQLFDQAIVILYELAS